MYFSLDQMFLDAFSRDTQLIKADPRHKTYLSCALMARGNIAISDLRRNIDRSVFTSDIALCALIRDLQNSKGFKVCRLESRRMEDRVMFYTTSWTGTYPTPCP
jgi:hypothetical protein